MKPRILALYTLTVFTAGFAASHAAMKPEIVTRTHETIAYQNVAVCAPLLLPKKFKPYAMKQHMLVAAAIPASAIFEKVRK